MQTTGNNYRRLPYMAYIRGMAIPVFMRLLNYSVKVSACFFLQDFPSVFMKIFY